MTYTLEQISIAKVFFNEKKTVYFGLLFKNTPVSIVKKLKIS
jgi:hypothetical protein